MIKDLIDIDLGAAVGAFDSVGCRHGDFLNDYMRYILSKKSLKEQNYVP